MTRETSPQRAVFIAAITSDIGSEMARIYRQRGWSIIGTYRDRGRVSALGDIEGALLFECDVAQPRHFDALSREMSNKGIHWDLFISAIGQLSPIGSFFELDRREGAASAILNGIGQLTLLQTIFPFRRDAAACQAAFLVGGAISRSFSSYSAYSLGKLSLVKFCELIHEECPDLHAITVGTGWVATRIHQQTMAAGPRAGDNLKKTSEFLNAPVSGT